VNDAAAQPSEPDVTATLDSEVEEAISLCDGDVRAALRAMLVANTFLAAQLDELTRAVSSGFTRRKTSSSRQASEKLDRWREFFFFKWEVTWTTHVDHNRRVIITEVAPQFWN
jgi:hypothetical protein